MNSCCSVNTAGIVLLLLASQTLVGNKSSGWQVSVDSAKAAAERLVVPTGSAKLGTFAQWKDAKVGEATKYFGADGEPAAYCFPVLKKDTEVGYIIVSASRDQMPIQEFSASASPHKRADVAACRKAAREAAGNGKELGAPRYLYAAPGLYVVEFPVLEKGKKVGSVLVDTFSNRVSQDLPTATRSVRGIRPTADAAWSAITGVSSRVSPKRPDREFRYIINVPLTMRLTTADVTAGAAVLNYWGIRKPREIPEMIAQQLTKALSEGGTLPSAMQSFAQDRGFSLILRAKNRDAGKPDSRATFTDARMEADYGRPFLVTFASESASATHTGAGCACDELGQWLIIHTGNPLTEKPYSRDDETPWCRPGVVFVNWDCAVDSLTITTVQVNKETHTVVD